MPEEFIGPFPGHITDKSALIWAHSLKPLTGASVKLRLNPAPEGKPDLIELDVTKYAAHRVAFKTIPGLKADESYTATLLVEGMDLSDAPKAEFRTLPTSESGAWCFAFMSCHNPLLYEKKKKGDGWRLWKKMPGILWNSADTNPNLRFAILGGDQVYADEFPEEVRMAPDDQARRDAYIGVYQAFWQHPAYQRVMCNLPSVMMWDDHDIFDGWGSFNVAKYSAEQNVPYEAVFDAAKAAFEAFQASRNPPAIPGGDGFTCAFRHGRAGFLMLDLRSERRIERKGTDEPVIWTTSGRESVFNWIRNETEDLETLFIVSPVTFFDLGNTTELLASLGTQAVSFFRTLWRKWRGQPPEPIDPMKELYDDLQDSWSSETNRKELLKFLDVLFDWQNASSARPRAVIILTGDIHVGGMSDFFSLDPKHSKAPVIRQVISSPVGYETRPELGNRAIEKVMVPERLGDRYEVQHRHFFAQRNFAVVSLEPTPEGHRNVRVKFYREGIREPHQTVLSPIPPQAENIQWES